MRWLPALSNGSSLSLMNGDYARTEHVFAGVKGIITIVLLKDDLTAGELEARGSKWTCIRSWFQRTLIDPPTITDPTTSTQQETTPALGAYSTMSFPAVLRFGIW